MFMQPITRRNARPLEATIFHPNGFRTIIGQLFALTYEPDGTVRPATDAECILSPATHSRWDLAA